MTKIYGILNVTPDSFSDGGKYTSRDAILYRVEEMIKEGAAVIDVGGESTRPGYTMISDEEEISRVVPVIEDIKRRFETLVSIDTYKSQVAKAAVKAGANIINDIWGLQYDENMAKIVKDADCDYILMHNRSNVVEDKNFAAYMDELKMDVARAMDAGIDKKHIILDPGVGFAKTKPQEIEIMANLGEVVDLGFPVLLGASRKSCINYILDLPVDQRLYGTLATTAAAVMLGAEYVRVHDIKANYDFIKMFSAILKEKHD